MRRRTIGRLRLQGILIALILLSFVAFGERIESAIQQVDTAASTAALMTAGGLLFAADIALPIPSSVIALALVAIDPLGGALIIFVGTCIGHLIGYWLGRALPDRATDYALGARYHSTAPRSMLQGFVWLVATRPVPLLAESAVIAAGVERWPFRLVMPAVLLGDGATALAYVLVVTLLR